MKRLLGQTLLVVAVGVGSLALSPACVENDQSIFLRQVMAPPQNRQNGSCVYTPDPTQAFLAQGTLDLAIRDSYSAFILFGNQLSPRGEQLNLRAETNRAHINGAVVRVTRPDGASIAEFTTVGTGFADPSQANAPSYGVVALTLIDPATARAIGTPAGGAESTLVLANVKAFGETLGGVDLESGEFQFPIRICNGCLVDFTNGDDPATPERDCNLPLSSESSSTSQPPCQAGQDEPTPCQVCQAVNPLCRGEQQ